MISHTKTTFPQSPVQVAAAPSAHRANVSVTPCVCIMEAAVRTFTPSAPEKVSAVLCDSFTKESAWKRHHLTKPHVLPSVSRGDVFEEPLEETSPSTATFMPTSDTVIPTVTPNVTQAPTLLPVDPDAMPCSGRAFDAFLQLKNGSIYAFRGNPDHITGQFTSTSTFTFVTLLPLCNVSLFNFLNYSAMLFFPIQRGESYNQKMQNWYSA